METTKFSPREECACASSACFHVQRQGAHGVDAGASLAGRDTDCVVHRPCGDGKVSGDCLMHRPTKPGVACSNQAGRAESPQLAPGSRMAVRSYAARNRWFDVADLEQEAAVASLEASRTWKADGGASREWHEARIVASALSRLVAETRAPVSLPKHKGETWTKAAACRRAPVTGGHGEDESAEEHPALAWLAADGFEPLEDVLDAGRAAVELHRVLAEESEAARLCLLEEEKPQTVAQRLGVAVAQVYTDTARAMRHLRAALCPKGAV